MLGKNHLKTSVAHFATVAPLLFPNLSPTAYLLATAGVGLGSILPDIDQPQSLAGRGFAPVSTWLQNAIGHRTITHTVWAILFFAILFFPIYQLPLTIPLYYGLLSGYTLHLIQDFFSQASINILWPLPRPLKVGGYRVGGTAEYYYTIISIIFGIIGLLLYAY